jgi:tRNA (guanine-N(7)-)-methyltransferase subunit TRM82
MPASHGNMLVSAGGEPTLQVWDWEAGKLVSRIEIFPAVLPYRRVRPSARRLRSKRKAAPSEIAPSDDPTNEGFYIAADGSMYPTGQGVCVEKIDSVVVDGKTVVLFFSEGCTAVHSFVLPISADEKPTVNSQSFNYPVLGLAAVPGSAGQVVVTLDASYDIKKGDTEVDAARATGAVAVIEVSADASVSHTPTCTTFTTNIQLSDITASSPLVATLTAALSSSTATPAVLATLSLYPNLSLFPRWPGFEEDEELAGPAAETTAPSSEPASFKGMTGKQLGKLKAQGAAVPRELLWKKSKKRKTNKKDGEESNGAEAEAEAEVPAVAAGDEATQNA